MAGFEPALSGTPSRRIARLSHILIKPQSRRVESNHLAPILQTDEVPYPSRFRRHARRYSFLSTFPDPLSACRAGVEPAQLCEWVTATWAHRCPADTC